MKDSKVELVLFFRPVKVSLVKWKALSGWNCVAERSQMINVGDQLCDKATIELWGHEQKPMFNCWSRASMWICRKRERRGLLWKAVRIGKSLSALTASWGVFLLTPQKSLLSLCLHEEKPVCKYFLPLGCPPWRRAALQEWLLVW